MLESRFVRMSIFLSLLEATHDLDQYPWIAEDPSIVSMAKK